jgi:hypothetical protein
MAKLFYTLEEASQALGLSLDEVKQMAASGKIQQFRDRDKLMYKREQVDALKGAGLAAPAAPAAPAHDTGGPIEVAHSGDTDKIDLQAEPKTPAGRKEDPRQATGISVFDADEIEPADPMAQTQVTQPVAEEEDLALESVGSGSGLLDLTRESDDTSLGAELLDEIYPGGSPEGSDQKLEQTVGGGSGLSASVAGSSGLDNLQQVEAGAGPAMVSVETEAPDPAGNGLGLGLLAGTAISLVCLLIVAVGAVSGTSNTLLASMIQSQFAAVGILLGLSVVLGVVGYVVGRAIGS